MLAVGHAIERAHAHVMYESIFAGRGGDALSASIGVGDAFERALGTHDMRYLSIEVAAQDHDGR